MNPSLLSLIWQTLSFLLLFKKLDIVQVKEEEKEDSKEEGQGDVEEGEEKGNVDLVLLTNLVSLFSEILKTVDDDRWGIRVMRARAVITGQVVTVVKEYNVWFLH